MTHSPLLLPGVDETISHTGTKGRNYIIPPPPLTFFCSKYTRIEENIEGIKVTISNLLKKTCGEPMKKKNGQLRIELKIPPDPTQRCLLQT